MSHLLDKTVPVAAALAAALALPATGAARPVCGAGLDVKPEPTSACIAELETFARRVGLDHPTAFRNVVLYIRANRALPSCYGTRSSGEAARDDPGSAARAATGGLFSNRAGLLPETSWHDDQRTDKATQYVAADLGRAGGQASGGSPDRGAAHLIYDTKMFHRNPDRAADARWRFWVTTDRYETVVKYTPVFCRYPDADGHVFGAP